MSLGAEDFRFVRDLLEARIGIRLEDDKAYLVEARLEQVAARKGLPGPAAVIQALRREPGGPLAGESLEALTTGETYFFRDGSPFQVLREKVLPELIARRGSRKVLNVWSAACSTGQEPYSIAITWKEAFPHLADWTLNILASDISSAALAKAREGVFTATDVARGLSPGHKARYFAPRGEHWALREDIRASVHFFSMNLCDPWPALPRQDVILLRNVLIYLSDERKKAVLAKAKALLEPDGFLYLGPAETTYRLEDRFRKLEGDRSGCFRPV
jgi:chemotaxis protein methyltransferase CheR